MSIKNFRSMKKIVYCLPQVYKPGGIERIVSIKANYFVEQCGYEVYIITACQKGQGPFYHLSDKIKMIDLNIDYDSTLTLPIWERIYKKIYYTHQHKKKLNRLLKKIKPDITISTFTHEASFLPQMKDGSKKVLEFHFCKGHKRKMADAFHFPFVTKLAYYIRCWQEENIIIPKYDQFIVLTKEDEINWKQKIHNVKHIPNILPFEKEGEAELTQKHVIAVGRLDSQKGFNRLIDIWALVTHKHPDWILDIYGKGRDFKKLQSQIDNYGIGDTTIIHKPDKNIKAHYLNSSIFVMTSVYEGLPMTLLEANGLGLPSICYDFPCGPKDVIKDGLNGFLVKEGDSDKFADRLLTLIENDNMRKLMGQKAYQMSERFSCRNIMSEWVNLFNELIKK